jgi:hypothetical protein
MHLLQSGEDGVDLEGEAPSLRINIVLLQHVDVLPAQILPLGHRFFDPSCLRDLLPQDFNDSRLAAANVAFNCVVEVVFWQLRVEDGGLS